MWQSQPLRVEYEGGLNKPRPMCGDGQVADGRQKPHIWHNSLKQEHSRNDIGREVEKVVGHLVHFVLPMAVVGEQKTLSKKGKACSQELDIFWNLNLFENENIHDAIDNEESAHCYMLSMQEEGVLSPPTS